MPSFTVIQCAITVAAWHSLWVEPFHLGIARIEIKSPKLPGLPSLRVLHLSDLHLERITLRERQLLEFVDELRPDLIIFTGDFLNLSYTHDERTRAFSHRRGAGCGQAATGCADSTD
jgi:predicted MPP superfamily phosphohydrolase